MNIAIFLQNRPHFGTTLTHLPLIHSLQLAYPNANIFLFSKNESTHLLTKIISIKKVFVTKNRFKEITNYQTINFDITISLRKNSLFLSSMLLLSKGKKYAFDNTITKLFFTKSIPYQKDIYRAENFLNLLPDEVAPHYFHTKKKHHITLIPAGEYKLKHWSIQNYLTLADTLVKLYPNLDVNFVLGQAEKDYLDIIKKHNRAYSISFHREVDELFEIITSSQLVIANDCGPAHIAQISDTSNIILYSDENFKADKTVNEWFRKKENARYIISDAGKSINTIKIETVIKTVQSLLI